MFCQQIRQLIISFERQALVDFFIHLFNKGSKRIGFVMIRLISFFLKKEISFYVATDYDNIFMQNFK